MDETPAYYDMVPTRTIDMVGTKIVDLLNSGHEKTRFSLVIAVRADGFLLPIGVILKNIPKCNLPKSVLLYVNESGTMDSKIMIVRILYYFE